VEPTYEFIAAQLVRIEAKLDRIPETFLARVEYEKRHDELLKSLTRVEADVENDMIELTNRVKRCEDNFTKLLWAFGGTVGIAGLGILAFLLQSHL
jgi:hypothetical protein